MKSSNLAERLEEFAATVKAVDTRDQKPTRLVALAATDIPPRAPRRRSSGFRRIEIRDPGLRHFRVF